jgi:hypothetical protein
MNLRAGLDVMKKNTGSCPFWESNLDHPAYGLDGTLTELPPAPTINFCLFTLVRIQNNILTKQSIINKKESKAIPLTGRAGL